MSKVIDAKKPIENVSGDELDALLEAYKKQNPVKYAAKLARGEFGKKK